MKCTNRFNKILGIGNGRTNVNALAVWMEMMQKIHIQHSKNAAVPIPICSLERIIIIHVYIIVLLNFSFFLHWICEQKCLCMNFDDYWIITPNNNKETSMSWAFDVSSHSDRHMSFHQNYPALAASKSIFLCLMLINLKWIRYTRKSILEWCVFVFVLDLLKSFQ